MRSLALRSMLASFVLAAMTIVVADDAAAQCATCPAPTVAYQPVVAQPTVAYKPYSGWYWGKWRAERQLRRAGLTVPTAYTAVPYTAAYAPAAYTTAYAPAYTAAYRPYVTSFAPLASPVAAPCNTCVQTVARPVLMRPVVVAPACNTCSFTPDCGCSACSTGCAACSSGVGQASCPTCVGGSSSPSVGQQTPQPSFNAVPAPADSQYRSQKQSQGGNGIDSPAGDDDPLKDYDPGPTTNSDSSTFNNAPKLLDPRGRTARSYKSRKPTVDVWTAVYRGPAKSFNVSKTSSQRTRTQAEIDADGWTAVPSNR